MEKQSEYLVNGHRFATYGMDYSHEILANFLKYHILDDFRGIWVSYRKEGPTSKLPDIIKKRSFFKIEMYFLHWRDDSNYSKKMN